jgi:hypothetical protein
MKHKIKNTKKSISITLSQEVIEIIDENCENRSKYLEYCIIKEMASNDKLREELKKKRIIL